MSQLSHLQCIFEEEKTFAEEPLFFGPSEVRAPAVGVAHAGGERSVHY